MRNTLPVFALVLLAAIFPVRAQILNGSFEAPVVSSVNVVGLGLVPGISIYTAGGNPNGITGWTVASGNVSLINASGTLASDLGLFNASNGNQYAILNGIASSITLVPLSLGVTENGNYGTLAQTFNTVSGKSYQISFNYRGLAVGALTNNPAIDVGLTNAAFSTAPSNGTLTANISLGAWQNETFNFVATGSNSTLSFFQDSTGGNVGVLGIDNVALTALPEPWQYGVVAIAFLGMLTGARVWSQSFEKLKVES